MANNALTISQISTVVNSLLSQAKGTALTLTDTADFITVAKKALETGGYDPMLNALSQVLSRTIFSVRPYTRKFKGLQVDNIRYGNHVRKVQSEDTAFINDQRLDATDTTTVDMQKVHAPKVLQTNFYGETTYEKALTQYKDQLDVAFNGADEFARFLTMTMTNVSDMIEQAHENTARFINANRMAGGTPIHLLTEYNALKGESLTEPDIWKKANFEDFIKFAYARIKTISNYMTERTTLYHTNITNHAIARHTPLSMQHMYVLSNYDELVQTTVLSSIFHDDYLKKMDYEPVNFWQSIAEPDKIYGKFTKLKADGTLEQTNLTTPAKSAKIFAHLFDDEAQGYTVVNAWAAPTPFNAAGGYSTTYWHFTDRYWNDFTENGVTFYLD